MLNVFQMCLISECCIIERYVTFIVFVGVYRLKPMCKSLVLTRNIGIHVTHLV